VGGGVSSGEHRNARVASWGGLLEDGIERCVRLRRVPDDWAGIARAELRSKDIDKWLSVAEKVTEALGGLGGGEYGVPIATAKKTTIFRVTVVQERPYKRWFLRTAKHLRRVREICGISILDKHSRMRFLDLAPRRRVLRREIALELGPETKFVGFFSVAIGSP